MRCRGAVEQRAAQQYCLEPRQAKQEAAVEFPSFRGQGVIIERGSSVHKPGWDMAAIAYVTCLER